MNYRKAVADAATALKRGEDANWTLARLTYEVCGPPRGSGGDHTSGLTRLPTLEQWSKDVAEASGRKFGSFTARLYRRIWAEYGEQTSHGTFATSWADAYDAVRGQTPDERMSDFNLRRGWENASPEAKQEALKTFARDADAAPALPTVMSEAVSSDQAVAGEVAKAAFENATPAAMDYAYRSNTNRKAFNEAGMRWYEENERKREQQTQSDPVLKKIDQARAAIDLQEWVDVTRKIMEGRIDILLNQILPRLGSLPEAQRDPLAMRMLLISAVKDLKAALVPIDNLIATGEYDLDTFVKEVLSGGSRG